MGADPHYVTSKVQETNDDLSLTNLAHFSQTNILSCRASRALSKGTKIAFELLNVWMQWPWIKKIIHSYSQETLLCKNSLFSPSFLGFRNNKEKERGGGDMGGTPTRKDFVFHGTLKFLCYVNWSDLHDMSCSIKCHMKPLKLPPKNCKTLNVGQLWILRAALIKRFNIMLPNMINIILFYFYFILFLLVTIQS